MSEKRHLTRTAVYVVLEKEGKAFFLRRANTGWADGMLTVPAGHVDEGEGVSEAAVKEVKEETGVTVDINDLDFIHVDYIKDEYVNFYFKAVKWNGEPVALEQDKSSEGVWFSIDDLPDDMVPQLRNMFARTKSEKLFSDIDRKI
jgi:mutator protein MutT